MVIRPATLDDVPACVTMGRRFRESTTYRDTLRDSPETMAGIGTLLVNLEEGLLLVAEGENGLVGMIGMVIFSHHLSGERVAGEVFWWVEPEARGSVGVRLMKQAEAWARSRKADAIQMVAPVGSRAGEIYDRLGYAPMEVAYVRSLHA